MKSGYLYEVCVRLMSKGWEEIIVKKGSWQFTKKNWLCKVSWKNYTATFTRL